MTPSETETLLSHMQVPGWPAYYVLGCFERRVTVYSQQVRALNLIWSLCSEKRLAQGDSVAVVGGGAAGLMTTAAALQLGCKVTVLEKAQTLLPMQRGCTHRWLHPHIYDWPEPNSTHRDAELPLMNWSAGHADAVVRELESSWRTIAATDRLKVHLNVHNITPNTNGTLEWSGETNRAEQFKIIVLAVGFGVEDSAPLHAQSYWRADSLHQLDPQGREHRYLVSGCGDGGLVDLLRIRICDFRHDQIVEQFFSDDGMEALQESLLDIETEARRVQKTNGNDAVSHYLKQMYQDLHAPSGVDNAFRLRNDTSAVLCSMGGEHYTLGASMLNRFLVSRICHHLPNNRVRLMSETLSATNIRPESGGYVVSLANGKQERFDQIIVRHGPRSTLEHEFRSIWEACGGLRARNQLDQTRKRLWPKGHFGPEGRSDGDATLKPADGRPLRHVPTARSSELSLTTYLSRIRERAGFVTLAGDTRSHPIQDVYVELEITQTGAVRRAEDDADEPLGEREEDPHREALRTELSRRSDAPWAHRSGTETLRASALIDLAVRTLIVGAAGTGKSTLLRYLACEAAKGYEEKPGSRLPVWLPKLPSHRDLGDNLAEALAKRALLSVGLDDGPSDARRGLEAAINRGDAVILIDSLDEADAVQQGHTAEWLSQLNSRVIVASRPLLAEMIWNNTTRVTLHGIPRIAAERMLRSYFDEAPWIQALIKHLHGFPDGQIWLETPVLLGLAATLYQVHADLPTSTLQLWDQAIDHMLQSDRLPAQFRGQALRPALQEFARRMLIPANGPPRVVFEEVELPAPYRRFFSHTGLFDGMSQIRFTHLGLGERLAAEADVDLGRERQRMYSTEAIDIEGSALEVLPMAHALQAPNALVEALADARTHDRRDHRLARLVLRAIGYGGEVVRRFCGRHADDIVRLVAERLQVASGRFGDAERALMSSAERAFFVLREHVTPSLVEHMLAPVLQTHGEAAAEAHVSTWLLGLREPQRREARWWSTIHRQARAIVRHCNDVDQLRQLTRGAELWDQGRALRILGQYPEHWPRLRPFLDHTSEELRNDAVMALADDAGAEIQVVERLTDDEARTRKFVVRWLGRRSEQRANYLNRLRGTLRCDPDYAVRAAAIDALTDDPASLRLIRAALEESIELPARCSSSFVALRSAAVRALADDTLSKSLIQRYVDGLKWSVEDDEKTVRQLSKNPKWRDRVLSRLTTTDVSWPEVAALAGDLEALPLLVTLLDRAQNQLLPVIIDTVALEDSARRQIVALLDHPKSFVRCAAIHALGKQHETWPEIRHFLRASTDDERATAVQALCRDDMALDEIAQMLHDPAERVRRAVVDAIGGHRRSHAALREYFYETRSKPAHEIIDGGRGLHLHEYIRAAIVRVLSPVDARSRALIEESLADPHGAVRIASIKALSSDPSMHIRLQHLVEDKDDLVMWAAYEATKNDPEIRARLVAFLDEDLWAVRVSAFRYLADHAAAREKLRSLLTSADAPGTERATAVEPLSRDPDSLALLRGQIFDQNNDVCNAALSIFKHDNEVRRMLRDRARDVRWLRSLSLPSGNNRQVRRILASDPEAHPILASYLESEDEHLLSLVVRALADYPPARLRTFELLDHPDGNVRHAAFMSLGRDEAARTRLLSALSSEDKYERHAAATALSNVPEVRSRFIALLDDEERGTRETAIDVLKSDRDPSIRRALRERVDSEPEEKLRLALLEAIAGDADAFGLLRQRLYNDPDSTVRKAAARALGSSGSLQAVALESFSSIADALAVVEGRDAPPMAARLRSWVKTPSSLDIDLDPELGELALAWVCVRLAWASEDGSLAAGRVFGEVAQPMERLWAPGQPVLIRIAMDVSELPRERFLRPNHNLIEAWRRAQYLRAANPPSVFLACADTGFEHLTPPEIQPGETHWGPTFFGFRLHT
ncbi:HEAT repeat domain-containing protein [Sorangium sp. So ce590]|uniref:HEAT repeat domain-containing protein n=1 Tax=Sorangium sp. So ce590 TaxID=3133317 RepID=UPI003F6008F4